MRFKRKKRRKLDRELRSLLHPDGGGSEKPTGKGDRRYLSLKRLTKKTRKVWRSPLLCSCLHHSCVFPLGWDHKVRSTRCHRHWCARGSQWSGGVSHRAAAGLLLARFQSTGRYGYCGEWEHWAVNNWRAVCFAAALLALSKVFWVPTHVVSRSKQNRRAQTSTIGMLTAPTVRRTSLAKRHSIAF